MTSPISNSIPSSPNHLVNNRNVHRLLIDKLIEKQDYLGAVGSAHMTGKESEIGRVFRASLATDPKIAKIIARHFRSENNRSIAAVEIAKKQIEDGDLESAFKTILAITTAEHRYEMLCNLWGSAFEHHNVALCIQIIEKIESDHKTLSAPNFSSKLAQMTCQLGILTKRFVEATNCLILIKTENKRREAINSIKSNLHELINGDFSDFNYVVQKLSENGEPEIFAEAAELLLGAKEAKIAAPYIEKIDCNKYPALICRTVYGVLVLKFSDSIESDFEKEPLTEESQMMAKLHYDRDKLTESDVIEALDYLKSLNPLHIDHVFARRKLITLLINSYPNRYPSVATIPIICELIDYLLSCGISQYSNECYKRLNALFQKAFSNGATDEEILSLLIRLPKSDDRTAKVTKLVKRQYAQLRYTEALSSLSLATNTPETVYWANFLIEMIGPIILSQIEIPEEMERFIAENWAKKCAGYYLRFESYDLALPWLKHMNDLDRAVSLSKVYKKIPTEYFEEYINIWPLNLEESSFVESKQAIGYKIVTRLQVLREWTASLFKSAHETRHYERPLAFLKAHLQASEEWLDLFGYRFLVHIANELVDRREFPIATQIVNNYLKGKSLCDFLRYSIFSCLAPDYLDEAVKNAEKLSVLENAIIRQPWSREIYRGADYHAVLLTLKDLLNDVSIEIRDILFKEVSILLQKPEYQHLKGSGFRNAIYCDLMEILLDRNVEQLLGTLLIKIDSQELRKIQLNKVVVNLREKIKSQAIAQEAGSSFIADIQKLLLETTNETELLNKLEAVSPTIKENRPEERPHLSEQARMQSSHRLELARAGMRRRALPQKTPQQRPPVEPGSSVKAKREFFEKLSKEGVEKTPARFPLKTPQRQVTVIKQSPLQVLGTPGKIKPSPKHILDASKIMQHSPRYHLKSHGQSPLRHSPKLEGRSVNHLVQSAAPPQRGRLMRAANLLVSVFIKDKEVDEALSELERVANS